MQGEKGTNKPHLMPASLPPRSNGPVTGPSRSVAFPTHILISHHHFGSAHASRIAQKNWTRSVGSCPCRGWEIMEEGAGGGKGG